MREWLGAVTTGGIVEYDEMAGTFFLPPEHAALLISPAGVGPLATANTVLAGHLHQIVQVFREGGGVPYAAFTPEFTDTMGRSAITPASGAASGGIACANSSSPTAVALPVVRCTCKIKAVVAIASPSGLMV